MSCQFQEYSTVIHTNVCILFQILSSYRVLKNIEYSSLCYTVGPFWLSILFYYILFIYFSTRLLEYNCSTMVHQLLLYNKVNQPYVYRNPHIPSHPTSLSHLSRWSQSTELISLCYAAASHQLSILHLVVYICPCHFLTSSQLTLPPPRLLKSILYVCVFIPVLPLGSSEPFFIFRFHIYVLAYGICFSLSDLLHSV